MKVFKRIVLFSIIIFVLTLASGYLVFTYLLKDDFQKFVEKEIDNSIEAEVTFQDLGIHLLRRFPNASISLHDLLILGKGDFRHDTLANVSEVQFTVNIFSLLSNSPEIKQVHFVNPLVNIYVLKDGRTNYNITKASSDTVSVKPTINLLLDQVSIENGTVHYRDWSSNTFATVKNLQHTGAGDFLKNVFDYKTETTIDQLSLNIEGTQYITNKSFNIEATLEVDLNKNKFIFKKTALQLDHFQLNLDGAIQQEGKDLRVDMNFDTPESSFKSVLSLIPGVYMKDIKNLKTKGEFSCSGKVNGKLSPDASQIPSFLVEVKVKEAQVRVDTLKEAFNNIDFDLVVSNNHTALDSLSFDLKSFHTDLGTHPIHGRLKVKGLARPMVDAEIIADVELASLENIYPIIPGADIKGLLNFDLKANGHLDLTKNKLPAFQLDLKMKDGYFKYDKMPMPITNIQFHLLTSCKEGNFNDALLQFNNVKADFGKNPFRGYLKLKGFPDTEIDTDLKASLDIEDVEKMYPTEGLIVKGTVDLDITAKGVYSQLNKKFPVVDAKLTIADGSVQSKFYPHPIKNIHFSAEVINKTGNVEDAQFNLNRVTCTLQDDPFEFSGKIMDLNKYQYNFNLRGKADLSKLNKVMQLDNTELEGLINVELSAKGFLKDLEKGDYSRAKSIGYISFKNMKGSGGSFKNPIAIKNALFTFTPSKIIMTGFEGKLGQSNVRMHGDIGNYMSFFSKNKDVIKADLDLDCDTLNLNEWMNPQTVTGKLVAATDTTHSQLSVIEIPKQVDLIFDSRIHVLKYQDMKVTDMDGEITFKNGVMHLTETGFNSLNAKFSVSGDYNTADLAHPTFDFDLNIKELDINKAYKEIGLIRQLAPSMDKVFGKFSIDYKLKGELGHDLQPKLETLKGGGMLRIAEAKINGMKLFEEISKSARKHEINDPHLKDFQMETEIRDNKIIVKPFSIRVNGFDADIHGENTMSGLIKYIVKIELIPLTKVKIPFHVTGRYDNPKVALGKGHTLPY